MYTIATIAFEARRLRISHQNTTAIKRINLFGVKAPELIRPDNRESALPLDLPPVKLVIEPAAQWITDSAG